MIYPPCKGCEHRHVGCHGACDAYTTYKQKLADEKDAIKKQQDVFAAYKTKGR